MVKKTLVLIHRVDYEYEIVVGCFTSKKDLYTGWKYYLDEYTRIERKEVTERLKLNLSKEIRSQEDITQIKEDRDTLKRIEEGSFLCYDKAKTLFHVYLVPKNSIRFNREPIDLDEFFLDEPICPWCMSLEYQPSTHSFSMAHVKPGEESDPASGDVELRSEQDQQPIQNVSRINISCIRKWGKVVLNWTLWLLGFPPLHSSAN